MLYRNLCKCLSEGVERHRDPFQEKGEKEDGSSRTEIPLVKVTGDLWKAQV